MQNIEQYIDVCTFYVYLCMLHNFSVVGHHLTTFPTELESVVSLAVLESSVVGGQKLLKLSPHALLQLVAVSPEKS